MRFLAVVRQPGTKWEQGGESFQWEEWACCLVLPFPPLFCLLFLLCAFSFAAETSAITWLAASVSLFYSPFSPFSSNVYNVWWTRKLDNTACCINRLPNKSWTASEVIHLAFDACLLTFILGAVYSWFYNCQPNSVWVQCHHTVYVHLIQNRIRCSQTACWLYWIDATLFV